MEFIGDVAPQLRWKSHSSDIKGFAMLSYLQIGNMGDCKECGSLVALLQGLRLRSHGKRPLPATAVAWQTTATAVTGQTASTAVG
jgi:hypothetical protein